MSMTILLTDSLPRHAGHFFVPDSSTVSNSRAENKDEHPGQGHIEKLETRPDYHWPCSTLFFDASVGVVRGVRTASVEISFHT